MRNLLFILILSTAILTTYAVTINSVTGQTTGMVPIYDASSGTWVSSGTDINGILIAVDTNTVCFPSSNGLASCDVNITWNGTDLVVSG